MATTNKYLLLDFGNSFVKAAIYDKNENTLGEIIHIKINSDPSELIGYLKKNNIVVDKIVSAISGRSEFFEPFMKTLGQTLNVPVKNVLQSDFHDIIDLSNFNKDVVIGIDILLCCAYGLKHLNRGIIFSFGSVYFVIAFEHGQLTNVLLIPNYIRGLEHVSKVSSIDASLIPQEFNTTRGLNTPDAFAAGATWTMQGLVNDLITKYSLPSFSVILTGGDAKRFTNLVKRYQYIDDLPIKALAQLVKFKCW